MNMELIKQFSSLCQQMKEDGGLINIGLNEIHMYSPVLTLGNYQVIHRKNNGDFPYQVFTVIDGVKVYSILTEQELKQYPELYKEMFPNEDR